MTSTTHPITESIFTLITYIATYIHINYSSCQQPTTPPNQHCHQLRNRPTTQSTDDTINRQRHRPPHSFHYYDDHFTYDAHLTINNAGYTIRSRQLFINLPIHGKSNILYSRIVTTFLNFFFESKHLLYNMHESLTTCLFY